MARGLSVDIDEIGLKAIASQFGATPKQVEAAMRSTFGRMGRWARTRAVRGLSAQLNIQQKILRRRVKSFRMQYGVSGGGGSKVWFGMRPVSLSHLHPRKAGRGVRADGGRYYEGAFIVQAGSRRRVFKRDGVARLPIREVEVNVVDEMQVYIEDNLVGSPEFELQFFKTLEHELKWRTQILK